MLRDLRWMGGKHLPPLHHRTERKEIGASVFSFQSATRLLPEELKKAKSGRPNADIIDISKAEARRRLLGASATVQRNGGARKESTLSTTPLPSRIPLALSDAEVCRRPSTVLGRSARINNGSVSAMVSVTASKVMPPSLCGQSVEELVTQGTYYSSLSLCPAQDSNTLLRPAPLLSSPHLTSATYLSFGSPQCGR